MAARGRRGGRETRVWCSQGNLKRGKGVVGGGARWRGGPQHAIYVLSVEEDDNDQREEERRGTGQKWRRKWASGRKREAGLLQVGEGKGQGEEKERAQGEVKGFLLKEKIREGLNKPYERKTEIVFI
jgi:hypothetical protein